MSAPRGAIMACVDGSADSDRAVEWAANEATQQRAPLHLIHALPPPASVIPYLKAVEEEFEELGKRIIADATATVEHFDVAVTSEIVDGPAVPALLAAGEPASVIVVGSRGHGAVAGLLLGSVSQHLSQHASCPVVVVREQADQRAERIVVGVDGSPGCDKAVGFALGRASRSHAPVVAVHAWQDISAVTPLGSSDIGLKHVAERVSAGERLLNESLAGWTKQYPDVTVTREAIPVHPARVLADASEHGSLVVVGSRGRGEFAGLLLGSVSQAVLHHARCPVAVVR